MKLFPLICTIWLVALCPSWAGDQDKRFLEFSNNKDTVTYDLNTVQIIQPGKFTIIQTSVDNPDVMKLELKVLDTLRTYCARPDGQYPAPADLLTLGPPDLPVENIEVKSDQIENAGQKYPIKRILWSYPYARLGFHTRNGLQKEPGFFDCGFRSKTESQMYSEMRGGYMNGTSSREVFDCKRGLFGFHWYEDDPAKTYMLVLQPDTRAFEFYWSLCKAVTHEEPYEPK